MNDTAAWIVAVSALLALMLAMLRLVLGPTQADRVIALDVVFSANIAMMAAAAMLSGRALYLDVAAGLALVSFVAAMVWARLVDSDPSKSRVEPTPEASTVRASIPAEEET